MTDPMTCPPAGARYAVLLRAVNGAPRNRLTMSDLRGRITGLGFCDVNSHLQTGNIALTDPYRREPEQVAAVLERGLAQSGLIRTDAVVWRPAALGELVGDEWFAEYPAEHWRRCASFLRIPPGRDGTAFVRARGATVVHSDDRIVLTAFPLAWANFGLALERAYQTSATTRWWNVVTDFVSRRLT